MIVYNVILCAKAEAQPSGSLDCVPMYANRGYYSRMSFPKMMMEPELTMTLLLTERILLMELHMSFCSCAHLSYFFSSSLISVSLCFNLSSLSLALDIPQLFRLNQLSLASSPVFSRSPLTSLAFRSVESRISSYSCPVDRFAESYLASTSCAMELERSLASFIVPLPFAFASSAFWFKSEWVSLNCLRAASFKYSEITIFLGQPN